MTIFLNKKNKAHIYDVLNKYFKIGYFYDVYVSSKIYDDNKSQVDVIYKLIDILSTNNSICGNDITLSLKGSEIDITIEICYDAKIEFKGDNIIISLPYDNDSGYGRIIKIKRITPKQQYQRIIDYRELIKFCTESLNLHISDKYIADKFIAGFNYNYRNINDLIKYMKG